MRVSELGQGAACSLPQQVWGRWQGDCPRLEAEPEMLPGLGRFSCSSAALWVEVLESSGQPHSAPLLPFLVAVQQAPDA